MRSKPIDVNSYLKSLHCYPKKEVFNYLSDKTLTVKQNLEIAAFADKVGDHEQAVYFLEKAYRIQRDQTVTTQKLVEKYFQTGMIESAITLLENAQNKGILTQEIVQDISKDYSNIIPKNYKSLKQNRKTLLITDSFYPQISPSHSTLNWQITKNLLPNTEIAVLCMDIPQFSQYPEKIILNLEQKVYRTLPCPSFSNKNPNKNVNLNRQIIDTINAFIKSYCPEYILIVPNFMQIDTIENNLSMQSIKYRTIIDKISLCRHQNDIFENKPNRESTSPSNGVAPYPLLPSYEIPCIIAYSEKYNAHHIQTILRTLIRIIKKIGICYCTIFEDIDKGNLKETVTQFGLERNLKFLKRNKRNFDEVMASHNIFIDLGCCPTHLLDAFKNDLIIISNNSLLQKAKLPSLSLDMDTDKLSEKILSLFKDESKTLQDLQKQQKKINHKKLIF